ncbi:hypothetical protein IWX90DRAFT_383940 [Phyllosticta citrichinensis]|uniref:GST N-terminal domain-containing protein n=1 Tax=Phyllosticta citrichinensis TaxID=1130410 RepID=A0ABR1XXW2_9PEZI
MRASQERQSQQRPTLPVVLFGYEGSTFTLKARLALRLKQIPYTFVPVPGMAPRPIFRNAFALPYRKVPVLAIGRDIYIDTFLILEILEHRFPAPDYPTLYPAAEDGRTNRALTRLLTAYWADRPLFRASVGLMPAWLWRSPFGKDRGQLIGHPLDAEKSARKIPENLTAFDVQLNVAEDWLRDAEQAHTKSHKTNKPWLLNTPKPSAADIALWHQLKWARDVARGENANVLGCEPEEGESTTVPIDDVFNPTRYPCVSSWFERFQVYVNALPKLEKKVEDPNDTLRAIKNCEMVNIKESRLQAIAPQLEIFDSIGLKKGAEVVVSPNDTGRADLTTGTLVDISAEQVVIQPGRVDGRLPDIQVRLHFPRVGFVIRPSATSKL